MLLLINSWVTQHGTQFLGWEGMGTHSKRFARGQVTASWAFCASQKSKINECCPYLKSSYPHWPWMGSKGRKTVWHFFLQNLLTRTCLYKQIRVCQISAGKGREAALIQSPYYILKCLCLKRNHSAINKSNQHLDFQGQDVSPVCISLPRLQTVIESIINVPLALQRYLLLYIQLLNMNPGIPTHDPSVSTNILPLRCQDLMSRHKCERSPRLQLLFPSTAPSVFNLLLYRAPQGIPRKESICSQVLLQKVFSIEMPINPGNRH